MNYDALRAGAKDSFADEIGEVRAYVSKLQTAQRAGEKALDMYDAAREWRLCFSFSFAIEVSEALFRSGLNVFHWRRSHRNGSGSKWPLLFMGCVFVHFSSRSLWVKIGLRLNSIEICVLCRGSAHRMFWHCTLGFVVW